MGSPPLIMRKTVVDLGLKPVISTIRAVHKMDKPKIQARLAAVGAKPVDMTDANPKTLMRQVMQRFMPAAECLVEMVYRYLPSPRQAQAYRAPYLYGATDASDPVGQAIARCDPHGPLCMFVSKIMRIPKSRNFYCYGRIFSGSVSVGQKLSVLRTADEASAAAASASETGAGSGAGSEESKLDTPPHPSRTATPRTAACAVQRVVRMMAASAKDVRTASAGEVIALVGVDKFLSKSATLTDHPMVKPIRPLDLSVSPVVRLAVRATKPSQTPKLVDGLRTLAKEDTCVEVFVDPDTGEHVVAGAGELQLEVVLKRLQDSTGVAFTSSDPMVAYRETVTRVSDGPYISGSCLAKSANKHIRLYFSASPLGEELVATMESGRIGPNTSVIDRSRMLTTEFGWDSAEARKVWAIGPSDRASATMGSDTEMPTNILVDLSHGVDNLHLIKDHIIAAFQQVCTEGHLCRERLRGVRFEIRDAKVIPDPAHRGGNQVLPAAKRGMQAAAAAAGPALFEPMFLLEVHCPGAYIGAVFSTLSKRRATILADDTHEGGAKGLDEASKRHAITARIAVADSFGCAGELRGSTSGRAFPQSSFDGWAVVDGTADVSAHPAPTTGRKSRGVTTPAGDRAAAIVADMRVKKGLPATVPGPQDLGDRL